MYPAITITFLYSNLLNKANALLYVCDVSMAA